MKILAAILGALIVLIQYPLWLGKGGWLRVWELDRQYQADVSERIPSEMSEAASSSSRRIEPGM